MIKIRNFAPLFGNVQKQNFSIAKFNLAFTLSELLMSVLVVSIILVAMAPVITKRTSDNISVTGVKTEGILFTPNSSTGEGCMASIDADGTSETECIFNVPDGVNEINAIVVGAGGNGSSADVGNAGEELAKITSNTTWQPPKGIIENFKIKFATAAGSRGGAALAAGGGYDSPITEEKCKELNAIYYNGMCITKANVGDTEYGGPSSEVAEIINLDVNSSCSKTGYCCWHGVTSNPEKCTNTYTGNGEGTAEYGGCNRTVCGYYAARLACENYSIGDTKKGQWRLPFRDDFVSYSCVVDPIFGPSELNLCDIADSSHGAAYCPYSANTTCKSSESNGYSGCVPGQIWTLLNFESASESRVNLYLQKGQFCPQGVGNPPHRGLSARCILSTKIQYYSGGGGASSPYLVNYKMPMFNTNENDGNSYGLEIEGVNSIVLTIVLKIKNESGSFEDFKVQAQGENCSSVRYNPYRFTILNNMYNSTGRFAEAGIANDLYPYLFTYYDNGTKCAYKKVELKRRDGGYLGKDGEAGSLKRETDPFRTVEGGNGGGSSYERYVNKNYSVTIGGAGGTEETPDGQPGEYGAGGGGGAIQMDAFGKITKEGKGGLGGNGIVVLSYDLIKAPPVGSGGGGAGAVIAKGIKVEPKQQLRIKVADSNSSATSFIASSIRNESTNKLTISAYSGTAAYQGKVCDPDTKKCNTFTYNANGTLAVSGSVEYDGTVETKPVGRAHATGGLVSDTNNVISSYKIYKGADGEAGTRDVFDAGLYTAAGGAGGYSGIETETTKRLIATAGGIGGGGCGGYYDLDDSSLGGTFLCFANPITGKIKDGSDAIFNVPDNPTLMNLGKAGSGGGGGGWAADDTTQGANQSGTGGKGAPGYVYIWWTKVE